MPLTRCQDIDELTRFLKLDYANNLYFFTYLPEIAQGDRRVLVLVYHEGGRMVLAALISPVHFCLAAGDDAPLEEALNGLPVESVHVLGKAAQIGRILGIINTPARKPEDYTLCRLNPDLMVGRDDDGCQKAGPGDLDDLVRFYRTSDMLVDCENRLPGMLEWGTVYLARQEGRIVSAALTSTQTEEAAMIGAVFTEPGCRGMGYSGACMRSLSRDLHQKRKAVYLFYKSSDQVLKKMYEDQGFQGIESWILATRADI